ncbi:MAG TPA: sulfite oxidase [Nocardioidaceae bacterium]|nr:sulfite oxidase [Nocardioidaceae bacterium]
MAPRRSVDVSRRRFLKLTAGVPLAAGLGPLASPAPVLARRNVAGSPIVKPLPPEWFVDFGTNAEMRWDAAADLGYRVPNERFFVRDHTATPLIDAATWRLRVFGSGLRGAPGLDDAVEFEYYQLRSLPSYEIDAVIECAGNGRSFFASQQGTPAAGTPWGLGAIGLARWRGVRLAEVLERAGIRRDAVDVMPEGLDATVVTNGVDHGHVRRPLPVWKALDDALLAYEMNGEPLPPDHGFPVRLVVPGWIGIASIKWLGQIEVSDQPLSSPWNTLWYRLTGPDYPADSPPITDQAVKSAFELPWNAALPARTVTTLTGRSWSGQAPIRRVEVSTDGGQRWRTARLAGPNRANGWVRWELPWRPTSTGNHTLLARAVDESGRRQPATVPFNDGGYLFWAVVHHPVTTTT